MNGELRATNRADHLRRATSDLNLGKDGLTEDILDGVGGSYRIAEEESLALHTDPHQERAKRRFLPGVGKGGGVDRGLLDAARVEVLVDVCTDLEPGTCDGVLIDRARLADVGLRLRTRAFRPGRARLVNTGRTARHAKEVFICAGVSVLETGRVRDDVALVGLELAKRVDSRWDEGRDCVGWRRVSELHGDAQTQLVELFVEVKGVKCHWEGTVSNENKKSQRAYL